MAPLIVKLGPSVLAEHFHAGGLTLPPTWEQEQISSRTPCRAVLTSDPLKHQLLLQEILPRNLPNTADLSLHHVVGRKKEMQQRGPPHWTVNPSEKEPPYPNIWDTVGPQFIFVKLKSTSPFI